MDFIAQQPLDTLYVSIVSLAEIRFGIERVGDPGRRSALQEWLIHQVRPMFQQRMLPLCEDIVVKWRQIVEDGQKDGHTFSQPDLFIAATALYHGMTLVTRDTGDFVRTRVPLFNPWVDSPPTGHRPA